MYPAIARNLASCRPVGNPRTAKNPTPTTKSSSAEVPNATRGEYRTAKTGMTTSASPNPPNPFTVYASSASAAHNPRVSTPAA